MAGCWGTCVDGGSRGRGGFGFADYSARAGDEFFEVWGDAADFGETRRLYTDGTFQTNDGRARLIPTAWEVFPEPPTTEFPLVLAGLSAAFGQICHQDPSRALLAEGPPSLLCARCLGTLAGGVAALLLSPRLSRDAMLSLLAIGAAAWLAEAGWGPWPAEARMLAGTTIGLALVAPFAEAYPPRTLC